MKQATYIRARDFLLRTILLLCLIGPAAGNVLAIDPVSKDGVTLRFVEAGEFRESHVQGMELEVVNGTGQTITCDVRLVHHRAPADDGGMREVQRVEKQVTVPAHARQGFRVAEPLIYGACRVDYEVKVNGAILASSSFAFRASGPYQLGIRPWFLTRNAVEVNVRLLEPDKPTQRFRFKLLDKNRRKVLFQSDDFTRIIDTSPYADPAKPKTTVQGFVSLAKQRPGEYVVEVDVIDPGGGSPVVLARLGCPVNLP